jgi:hypothetical protein
MDSDGDMFSPNETNNEEDDGDFPDKQGSLTLKALNCSVLLDITVEFQKWGSSPVFNMVEVTVNVSKGSKEDGLLSAMIDEEPVRIKFEIMSSGKMLLALIIFHLTN